MSATAAHLIEDVLPVGVPLRQWVLHAVFLDGVYRDEEEDGARERAGLSRLAASAVSGAMPPAGP
jgi:hypothetical protein